MSESSGLSKASSNPSFRGTAKARAWSNLALVKYFGKRNLSLNLPAAPSLSLTLEPLATTTRVTFDSNYTNDEFRLNGAPAPESLARRAAAFLDIIRQRSGLSHRANVETENNFPTAAGLASSASGFAALALAASTALDLKLTERELSALARRGSGSAARSVTGGVSLWHAGQAEDGSDSFAETIAGPEEIDLRVVVGVCDPGPKAVGSTEAMEHTRLTSPYYQSWLACVEEDIEAAKDAVKRRDIDALGEVTERNALAMHAAALSARPGIAFWRGPTIEGLHLARELRKDGTTAYFTCDAGPQPKMLCSPESEEEVAEALSGLPGIEQVIRCRLGGAASIVD